MAEAGTKSKRSPPPRTVTVGSAVGPCLPLLFSLTNRCGKASVSGFGRITTLRKPDLSQKIQTTNVNIFH
jgi:hypothetical protein